MTGPGQAPLAGPTERPSPRPASWRRLLALLRPEAARLGVVVVSALVGVSTVLAAPRLLGAATDLIFRPDIFRPDGTANDGSSPQSSLDHAALARTLVVVVLVYLVGASCTWVQGYLMARVAQRTAYNLREAIAGKLTRLPVAYFDTQPRGDLLSRVTNDVDNVTIALHEGIVQLITAAVTIVGVLALMLWISGWLTLLTLLALPLSFVLTTLVARHSPARFALWTQRTGDLNGQVEEVFSGVDVVAVHGRREAMIESFDDLNDSLYSTGLRAHVVAGILQPITVLLEHVNYVVIAVTGALFMTSGRLSLGEVQAFIQYTWAFTGPFGEIADTVDLLQCGLASAKRVFELLDAPEEVPDTLDTLDTPDTDPPSTPSSRPSTGPGGEARRGHVHLCDVSFRYSPTTPWAINDVNLEVAPGRTVALVGPTGAGKTTLVNLLLRFHEITSGVITVDGVDIRRLPRDVVRRYFGLVMQDTWLFEGTIWENIAYGAPDVGEAALLRAAGLAHVDRFVHQLPHGYDTVLHENGVNISAGGRQLLALARAFLIDPPILVLDEATSCVDPGTEVLVRQATRSLRDGRTSFVIAHRLATVREADSILVMNNGRIVEQGTHEELLHRKGQYSDLCASQYQGGSRP